MAGNKNVITLDMQSVISLCFYISKLTDEIELGSSSKIDSAQTTTGKSI